MVPEERKVDPRKGLLRLLPALLVLAVLGLSLGPSVSSASAATCNGTAYSGDPVDAVECAAEFARIIRANWTVGETTALAAEAALMSNPVGRRIAGRLMIARIGGGLVPRLGTIGAVSGAFSVGWLIGGALNKWLGLTGEEDTAAPPTTCPAASTIKYYTDYNHPLAGYTTVDTNAPAGWYVVPASSGCRVSGVVGYANTWTQAQKDPVIAQFARLAGYGFHTTNFPLYNNPSQNITVAYMTDAEFWASSISEGFQNYTNQNVTTTSSPGSPTDAQLLAAARAEAAADAEFRDWVRYRLDPETYASPTTYTLPTIELGETAEAYRTRLMASGKLGTITIVDASEFDGRFEPGAALGSTPKPGTAVEVGTAVEIRANPDGDGTDAPVGSVGGCTPWATPDLDLSPFAGVDPNKFPFGIFGWLYTGLTDWTIPGEAPSFTFPVLDWSYTVDFAVLDPMVQVVRPMLLIIAGISLVFWLSRAVLGMGSTGSKD